VDHLSDALNASVDVVNFNRADAISSVLRVDRTTCRACCFADAISSVSGIVQRRTLVLGFCTNPTGLELRSS